MPTRLTSVVIDAADPAALARFWSEATGWPITYEGHHDAQGRPEEVIVEPPEGDDGVPALPGGEVG